jgi:uncharacterized protein
MMNPAYYGGQTTLITGASSGIGAEFAHQLAERGSDLILVARRLDRLESLAEKLSERFGVRVEAIALDLSQPAVGAILAAEVERRGLHATSRINNAGFGTYGQFPEEDAERVRKEIALDVSALVDISHAFIGALRTSGAGLLINVASNAAYQPTPNMAVYGAAKAFVLSFTEALWYDARHRPAGTCAVPGRHQHRVLRRGRHRPQPMAAHHARLPRKSLIQHSACSTARIRHRA